MRSHGEGVEVKVLLTREEESTAEGARAVPMKRRQKQMEERRWEEESDNRLKLNGRMGKDDGWWEYIRALKLFAI